MNTILNDRRRGFIKIMDNNKKLIQMGHTDPLLLLSINLRGIQYVPQNKHEMTTVILG